MCHAHVDPKYLMQDTEAAFRAAQAASQATGEAEMVDDTIPPHLIPGWRGVWARCASLLPKRKTQTRIVAAE